MQGRARTSQSTGVKGDAFDQLEKRLGSSETKNSMHKIHPDQQQSVITLYSQGKLQQALDQKHYCSSSLTQCCVQYMGADKGLSQFDDAIEAYKMAITIKPDYAEAYYNMGIALKDVQLEEAPRLQKYLLNLILLTPIATWAMHSKSRASWRRQLRL